jgi:hypothetical protein
VVIRALGGAESTPEHRDDLHDEWFEGWSGGAHDGEVDFEGGPVGCGAGEPGLVFGVVGDKDEEVEADDGDDNDAADWLVW